MKQRIRQALAPFRSRVAVFRRDTRGQGMTEYIIIVALIAIATIGFVSVFGDNVRGLFGASATALNGQAADVNAFTKKVDTNNVHRDFSSGVLNAPP
jgi:Flp pilus assembly pilin Flp